MFCKKCGHPLPEGTKFCGACGTPVQTPEGSVPADAQPESRSIPLSREKDILSRSQYQPAPLKKRPSDRKLLLIVGALAVMILAAVLLFTLFGGKTVYLMTKYVQTTDTDKYTTEYGFDEDGNLTEYRYIHKYQSGSYRYGWSYEYEDGRIVSAEYESDDLSFDLEYSYDRDGNLEAIEGDGFEGEISCDKHGRITEMEFEGRFEITLECSYHDNGFPDELEYSKGPYRFLYVYNEAGKLLEETTYLDDEISTVVVYTYDSEGRQTEYEYKRYYAGQVFSETYTAYEYDSKGNLIGASEIHKRDDKKLTLEYECTLEGNTREWVVTRLSGDAELHTFLTRNLEEGDTYMKETLDDAGNRIERITYGDTKLKETWEYVAFRAPRGYTVPSTADPKFCQFLNQ